MSISRRMSVQLATFLIGITLTCIVLKLVQGLVYTVMIELLAFLSVLRDVARYIHKIDS